MARTPFLWGRGGQKLTPQEVNRQREIAAALLQSGADFSPATGGIYEALGRGFQGWASGRLGSLAREGEAAGIEGAADQWRALQGQSAAAGGGVPAGTAAPPDWDAIRAGIFAGESGGDYNALFGYANRDPNSPFYGTNLTSMTVDDALRFADPSGPYAQSVKGQVGRVATPMGAYQVVGSTLRAAKRGLGLTGNEIMTPELQDMIGQWIYANQGTGAWEGYRGPQSPAAAPPGNFGAIAEAMGDPWFAQQYGDVARALMQQQLAQADPAYQLGLQKAQLELEQMRNPAPPKPIEVGGVLLDPTTFEPIFDSRSQSDTGFTLRPGEQRFDAQGNVVAGVDAAPEQSAAEERIARMTENLMATGTSVDPNEARQLAVGIVDGRLKADRDPITGELQVVDMATGIPVYGRGVQPQGGAGVVSTSPAVAPPVGDGTAAFGVGGAARSLANTAGDVLGVGAPFPEEQQTQAEFNVLRESIMNDISAAYGRQPPSWLLKEIRNLTPAAGSPLEGPEGAAAKLNSLKRSFQNELAIAEKTLDMKLSPQGRQDAEARVVGLRSALARMDRGLQMLSPSPAPQEGETSSGIKWRIVE